MNRENIHIHSKYTNGCNLEIEEIAKELIKNNINYGAIIETVNFEQYTLPYILINLNIRNEEIDRINQEYKGITYDEGEYQSLVVTLGNGLGNNWWCVLFPPLCLLEGEESTDVEYRSYVMDIVNKYIN